MTINVKQYSNNYLNNLFINDSCLRNYFKYKNIDNIPRWNNVTNIYCWWDGHLFDTVPIGIPLKYNQKTNQFVVYGCFCSLNCAFAYFKHEKKYIPDIARNINIEGLQLFNLFKKKILGRKYNNEDEDKLVQAPPKILINSFGGPLTIEEFRKSSLTCTKFDFYETPMIMHLSIILKDKLQKAIDDIVKESNSTDSTNITQMIDDDSDQIMTSVLSKSINKSSENSNSNSGTSKSDNILMSMLDIN